MAGSINLANVALGFDSSKITKGVDLSAGEIRKLSGIVKASESSIDRYNRELKLLETAYSKGAISAKRMAEATEHLKKAHGQLDVAKVNAFSNGWTEMASKVALARQGFEALKGIVSPVFDEMNRIDAINDQAHKLGMSYRDLNTIQLSLGESSGLAAEDISKAMQKLSIGITEAISTGKGAHAEALKTLGLSASALAGKSQVNQLADIADAMEGIASQSERLKLTFDLFGKTGAGLVSSFDEGGGKLREMAEFADKVGLNLSGTVVEGINNANDSLARLSMATQGWMAQFSGGLAPSIGAIARDMTGMVSDAKALAKIGEDAGLQLAKNYAIWKDIMALNYNPKIAANWMAGKGELMPTYEKILDDIAKAQIQASDDAATKYRKNKQLGERADQTAKEEATAKELKATIQLFYEKAKLENDRINEENKKKAEYDAKEKKIWDDAGERDLKARFGNKNPMNISDTIAPALKAGSVEAYKFMLSQKDKAADIAERQAKIAEESKDILNKQLDALNNMPKLGLARR